MAVRFPPPQQSSASKNKVPSAAAEAQNLKRGKKTGPRDVTVPKRWNDLYRRLLTLPTEAGGAMDFDPDTNELRAAAFTLGEVSSVSAFDVGEEVFAHTHPLGGRLLPAPSGRDYAGLLSAASRYYDPSISGSLVMEDPKRQRFRGGRFYDSDGGSSNNQKKTGGPPPNQQASVVFGNNGAYVITPTRELLKLYDRIARQAREAGNASPAEVVQRRLQDPIESLMGQATRAYRFIVVDLGDTPPTLAITTAGPLGSDAGYVVSAPTAAERSEIVSAIRAAVRSLSPNTLASCQPMNPSVARNFDWSLSNPQIEKGQEAVEALYKCSRKLDADLEDVAKAVTMALRQRYPRIKVEPVTSYMAAVPFAMPRVELSGEIGRVSPNKVEPWSPPNTGSVTFELKPRTEATIRAAQNAWRTAGPKPGTLEQIDQSVWGRLLDALQHELLEVAPPGTSVSVGYQAPDGGILPSEDLPGLLVRYQSGVGRNNPQKNLSGVGSKEVIPAIDTTSGAWMVPRRALSPMAASTRYVQAMARRLGFNLDFFPLDKPIKIRIDPVVRKSSVRARLKSGEVINLLRDAVDLGVASPAATPYVRSLRLT